MGRGPVGKFCVAVAAERYEPSGFGRGRLRLVPYERAEYLVPFVCDVVEPGGQLVTDGSRAYDELASLGYPRAAVVAASPGEAHEHRTSGSGGRRRCRGACAHGCVGTRRARRRRARRSGCRATRSARPRRQEGPRADRRALRGAVWRDPRGEPSGRYRAPFTSFWSARLMANGSTSPTSTRTPTAILSSTLRS